MQNAHVTPPPSVRRVALQNFKSIKACDVTLGPLAVLVGPNASGKSNFLDALRFTADALGTTLDSALRDRGGVNEVRRRSGGHPNHFTVRLDLELASDRHASYTFRVGATKNGGFEVTDEECVVRVDALGVDEASFRRDHGLVRTTVEERLPAPMPDRLYLVSASSVEPFRQVYDVLVSMGFYNLSPPVIRQPQPPDPGLLLRRDGSNLASVLGHLEQHDPFALARVIEYLRRVAPGVEDVRKMAVGPMETIEFRQEVAGQRRPWSFSAVSMSDGTLRGLGVLIALLQVNGHRPSLVGLEEPEVALHPAAVGVLVDAIREAAQRTQIVMTSHSPELLDREDLDARTVFAVEAHQGVTTIGPMSTVGRQALQDRLFTVGELLRMNQVEPSEDALITARTVTPRLFAS